MSDGPALYRKALGLIPGGTQLLSKRPEIFLPDQWPTYYSRCDGVTVWSLEGRPYIDMSISGVGACVLGYADPDVDAAVRRAIEQGSMCTLNCPEEPELAELLAELHPWAAMARFTRSGGEAMAVAVRIARAHTGRERVAFSGYHGWHDWYLAAALGNPHALDDHLLPGLEPAGVPRALSGTAVALPSTGLEAVLEREGPRLAAIVVEPVRTGHEDRGFLERLRVAAERHGAVLIFDEITSGFRLSCGGAHLTRGVDPDVAVFAKGISNGYPMAAVLGKAEVMQAASRCFISSTSWTERIGPAAALATIRKHRRLKVHEHLVAVGERVREGWARSAERHGLKIRIGGIAPLSLLTFEVGEMSGAVQTLFTQEMLDRGFLAGRAFYASYAHQVSHVDSYLAAVEDVFAGLARAIAEGSIRSRLRGAVASAGLTPRSGPAGSEQW